VRSSYHADEQSDALCAPAPGTRSTTIA